MTTSMTPAAPAPAREGTFARTSTGVPAAVPAAMSVMVSAVGLAGVPVVTVATASAVTSAGEAA